MKFSDFISPDAILADLRADDKGGVIQEMVQSLQKVGKIEADEYDSVVREVLRREELGSTGIGGGVAVPHTKHASVNELVGMVAVSKEGVDFEALDGEKVHVFFLLISPQDRPGDHLRALEYISRKLRDEMFRRFLRQAKTREEIQQLLEEADNNRFGT